MKKIWKLPNFVKGFNKSPFKFYLFCKDKSEQNEAEGQNYSLKGGSFSTNHPNREKYQMEFADSLAILQNLAKYFSVSYSILRHQMKFHGFISAICLTSF